MVLELHAALLKRADAPDMSATLVRASSNGAGSYVALPGGTSFHKPDCVMLEGKQSASPVTAREVGARALVPCPLCEPAPVNA
jgi:hypothetical protein